MSAIQPNMNFDNQRQEHVPYQSKTPQQMQQLYDKLMKSDDAERVRTKAIANHEIRDKWFKKNTQ